MEQNNLGIVFNVVGRKLPEAGIEFIMIGGHAVNHYGYSRATIDIDFMIAASDMSVVRSVMKDSGFSNISESENAVFFEYPDIPYRVDFLQIDSGSMQKLLAHAERIDYAGISLKVPSLKDLLSMKLFALKHGSERREEKDFPDIVNLVIEHGLELENELKPLCEKFADTQIYVKLAERIRRLKHD